MKPHPRKKTSAPSLERGIDIVELLASSEEPLSFSEILAALGIPRASLVRILDTLRVRRIVDKMEGSGRYRLGMKLLYLGHRLKDKLNLRSVASPLMQRLADHTRETVELSTMDRDQLVLIDLIEGAGDVKVSSRIGAAYPYLHAVSVGKLYLAHMDPAKLERVLDHVGLPAVTAWTITHPDILERELGAVLRDGYATENQELRKGVRRVAAPIYDHAGRVAGGLSIAAPVFRMEEGDFPKYGELVREAAEEVSKRLGGNTPQAATPV